MGKQALDFKRGATFKIPPARPLVIGVDTKHKKGEHPLWDPRSFWDLNPDVIESMVEHGVDRWLEVGSGRTLCGFVKRMDRKVDVSDFESESWKS